MIADKVVINPSWENIFSPLLDAPNANPRITNWIRGILFPYIQEHLSEFCYHVIIERITASVEQAYENDRLLEVEGFVLRSSNRSLDLNVNHDPYVVKVDMTFENREFQVDPLGWSSPGGAPLQVKRSDTRISMVIRDLDNRMGCLFRSSGEVYLFASKNLLSDMADWLSQGARVPLTITKLPFKEAVRLSDEWHQKQAQRRIRESSRKAGGPGTREHIGRLVIEKGFSTPEDSTYDVFWLKDQQSLKHESILQHHCVDGYWSRVLLGYCVILHMRNLDPSKREDRWTVEMGLLEFSAREDDPETQASKSIRSVVVVRQFRGVLNCNPHPELATAFGNIFLSRTGELNDDRLTSFFKTSSWLNKEVIEQQLRKPFGILS